MQAARLILLFLTTPLGCATTGSGSGAGSRANSAAQVAAHDTELVHGSAEQYWHAVRWGDGSSAATFIEEPNQRLLYETWLSDQQDSIRYVDAQVLQVQLESPTDADPTAESTLATVYVRVERYTLPAQVLEEETLRQSWYKSDAGWWVSWEYPSD